MMNKIIAMVMWKSSIELPFSIGPIKSTYESWLLASNETGASIAAIEFSDPNCNLETYYHSLGNDGSDEDFISAAKEQSKTNWNTQLTASAVNAYIRTGFAVSTVESEF